MNKRMIVLSAASVVLLGAATAYGGMWIGSIALFSVSQDPDPLDTYDLEVSLVLTDSSGSPWVDPVTIVLKQPESGFVSTKVVSPIGGGQVDAMLTIPVEAVEAYAAVSVEVWDGEVPDSLQVERQFWLDPDHGLAAFAKPELAEYDTAAGYYVLPSNGGTRSLSSPPKYGELVVNNPNGQELSIALQDYSTNANLHWPEISGYQRSKLVGSNNVTLNIYRWSIAPAADVVLFGPEGTKVSNTLLRRTGQAILSAARENEFNLSVLASSFPTADEILFVTPSHHQPNPQAPSGSDILYGPQRARSLERAVVRFESGVYAHTLKAPSGNYVAELWGSAVNGNGQLIFSLLDSVVIQSSTVDPTIQF